MALSRESKLITLGPNSKFPKQGREESTLGKPSNLTKYRKNIFQRLANNNELLLPSEASNLSRQASQRASTIPNGFAEDMYGSPLTYVPETFYLLAECGAYDNMRLITECEGDRIEWINECV